MNKRTLLFFVVVISVIMLGNLSTPPTGAAAPIELTYANFPPAATFPCVQMERWAKEVETRTKGAVKVKTFPGGTLLPAKNIFDGVVAGTADIGNFAMSYQPGRFPISEAVDLPLGFSSSRASSMALYDLIEKYKAKEFQDVKIITLFGTAPAQYMTSAPVKSLADLKGMELRVPGTSADVVKAMGAVPIAMPQSDVPEALQKGVVKGQVTAVEVLKDFNYAAYTPYVTMTNLYVVTFAVIMNKNKWASLPKDVQKVIDDLGRDQALWTGTYVDNHCIEALNWSKEKYKLQIFELPANEQAQIPKLMAPIIDAYAKRVTAAGLPGEQIVKDALALKEKYNKEFK